jgi:hypothetical protein
LHFASRARGAALPPSATLKALLLLLLLLLLLRGVSSCFCGARCPQVAG